MNTSKFITTNSFHEQKFLKVTKNKHLAYKSYVYNDYVVIKAVFNLVVDTPDLLKAFKKVWSSLSRSEERERGIFQFLSIVQLNT